jgi:hypothetical protein
MSKPRSLLAGTAFFFALTGSLALHAEPAREVVVLNLPEIQKVTGSVSVDKLPPSSRFLAREAIVIPAVGRSESAHFVDVGTLDFEGMKTGQLSLHVESQGKVSEEGPVGVLLIPDRKPVLRSLNLENQILLATELKVDLPIGSIPVASQTAFEVAFPRYRIFFYNETNATAQADLYVYLAR